MSVPTTADALIQLIRKSGIIDENKLTAFEKAHHHDGLLQQEPKRIAHAMVRDGVLTCFHAEQFLLGKWRGFNLGKYRLLERIGVGGMGQVFLCEHVFMRKRVAIKVLPPHKAEDPVSLGRFYREARVASALDHPNIVRTYDIDQDAHLHFLVMEYVDGTSLLDIVKKFGPMNVTRACHYIKQAAIGLQYAHQSGMIHRDIKPGNIMIDREGNAKILDMGLARFYKDEKDQLTLKYDDKNVLGTADYVAPEQTRDSRNIDVRADVYGLGATFYFVLAGQPPFPDGTVAEKLIAHQTKKPRPIRELRAEVPQGLEKILEKMLAKDPADRYQSPAEVQAALEVWTQAPIAAPSAEEMPKLSLAAQPDLSYGRKASGIAAPAREAAFARSAETALGKTPVAPGVKASIEEIESAATVPFPKKPALPANVAATTKTTESMVDLLTPMPPKPSAGFRSAAEVDLVETRSTPSDPTPQTGAKTQPPEPAKPLGTEKPKSKLDFKIPGLDLSRLQKSRTGVETTPAISSPAGEAPKPGVNIPKPPPFLPGSREMPKPVVGLPGSREGLKPLPGSKDIPPPGTKDFRLPLPGSKDAPKPAPLPGSKEVPKPLPGSRDSLKPGGLSGSKVPTSTPAYRPPELMPFFSAPAVAKSKPGVFAVVLRWTVMMTLSTLIGAALGAGIWYFFLR